MQRRACEVTLTLDGAIILSSRLVELNTDKMSRRGGDATDISNVANTPFLIFNELAHTQMIGHSSSVTQRTGAFFGRIGVVVQSRR